MEKIKVVDNQALLPNNTPLPVQPYGSKISHFFQKISQRIRKGWARVRINNQKYWVNITDLSKQVGCSNKAIRQLTQPFKLELLFPKRKVVSYEDILPFQAFDLAGKIPREDELAKLRVKAMVDKHFPKEQVHVVSPKPISRRLQALLDSKIPQPKPFAYKLGIFRGKGSFKTVYDGSVLNGLVKENIALAKITKAREDTWGEMLKEDEIAKLFGPNDHVVAPAKHIIWVSQNKAELMMNLYDGDALETPQEERYTVALGAAKGLAALHREGYVHQDIKPDNVFRKDGKGYIADLGFAAKKEKTWNAGSPLYQAPELLSNFSGKNTFKTDIWSLGTTLYHIYEGKKLPILQYAEDARFNMNKFLNYMRGMTDRQVHFQMFVKDSKTPKVIQNLIRSMLNIDPSKRPSAKEVVTALEAIQKPQDAK